MPLFLEEATYPLACTLSCFHSPLALLAHIFSHFCFYLPALSICPTCLHFFLAVFAGTLYLPYLPEPYKPYLFNISELLTCSPCL